jgi:ethanolamine transporter EutH
MPDMIAAVIVGKLAAGITGVMVAYLLFARTFPAVGAGEQVTVATDGTSEVAGDDAQPES